MKKLFIVAGESSGDARAGEIIKEIKKHSPETVFEGLGGTQMKMSGTKIIFDLPSVAVIGLTDVLKKYFFFRKILFQALDRIKEIRPDAVILVDYPGFNLRLAKKIHALGIPVIYYVSPQVWAWANWRVKKIARIVDKMLVILPFEVDFYKKTSLDVEFVGHPLVDSFQPSGTRTEIISKLNLSHDTRIITILSGSRHSEIKKLLPVFIQAAEKLHAFLPNTHFLISKAPHLSEEDYTKELANVSFSYTLSAENMHNLITVADFCWVTSGTATLETTLGLTPYIIAYKTTWLTYFLARHLITIPYIGLANIIAGEKIIPEFIQHDAHPETIAHETKFILENPDAKKTMVAKLQSVKEKLGEPGAASRVARAIMSFLG